MATVTKYLRLPVPRPKTFLGLMSLQTGTEMISLALLFNKVTGVYGLLAILTGYSLSALQLFMYLYSVVAVVVLAFLIPHIRRQTAFQNLALAWLYLIDTAVNTAYTSAFAVNWYLTSAATPTAPTAPEGSGATQTRDEVVAAADAEVATKALGAQETAMSMVLIVGLTLVRIYFSLVVMAYARQVLRRFIENHAGWEAGADKNGLAGDPFAVGSALGEGWRGRLGRLMVSVGSGYWLSQKEDEEWTKDVSAKFRSSRPATASGSSERP